MPISHSLKLLNAKKEQPKIKTICNFLVYIKLNGKSFIKNHKN